MIKVIHSGRRSGKTVELIKICANDGGYIVCKDNMDAQRIHQLSIELGFKIHFPLTYSEVFKKRYYGNGVKNVHIDNVDFMIEQLMNDVQIKTMTISE